MRCTLLGSHKSGYIQNQAVPDSRMIVIRRDSSKMLGGAPPIELRVFRIMLVGCLACAALFSGGGWCMAAEHPRESAAKLIAGYTDQLEELAAWCDERGLEEEARQTRSLIRPQDPNCLYVTMFPSTIGREELPDDASDDVVEWRGRFDTLRNEQADELFAIARRAVKLGRASLAFDLAVGAIRQNPDHEAVRRLLGYQKYRDHWRTQYEIERLKKRQVWHERFGWLPAGHVKKYEDGKRYFRGRWITPEQDAVLHANILNGWRVRSEHYIIHTNHSLEAGVALGEKLERLYLVWKQLFVRFSASEEQVAAMFAGRGGYTPAGPHEVVYFRDRADYVRSLKPAFENIDISLGIYVDSTRKAYFFADEESDDRTLYHEATHQLFHESRKVPPTVAQRANFWVVEGIAMYMESLREENGFYVLGGFDDLRMLAARYRLIEDEFYVPLAQFAALGMFQIQNDPRIATLYSQAAGLTHFLIHYDGGRYRDSLVAYLATIYSGRGGPATLSQLTGVSYAELDRQYREFMEAEK